MSENIDKIYYINLEKRTDRKEQIEKELDQFGLPYERINAIEHTEGCIGCSCSHLFALKKAKEKGYKNVLIMEDDALFYDCDDYKSLEIIEFALDELSKIDDWEIYFLGSNIHDKELNLKSPHLIKCGCCISLQGYIVNQKCFDKILENKFDKPYDVMDIFINNNFTEKYITHPVVLLQNGDGLSDIGGHKTLGVDFWLNNFNKPIIKNY